MFSDVTIYNFLAISERLLTAGQPQATELQQLLPLQVQLVINLGLENAEYSLPDESALLKNMGIAYMSIPVAWESPRKEQLIRFLAAILVHEQQRILVHCAANKRVSIFIGIYQLLFLQRDRLAVETMISTVWQPNLIWQQFMQDMLNDQSLKPAVIHYRQSI